MKLRSDMYQLFGIYQLSEMYHCQADVRSDMYYLSGMYPLSSWCKLDPECISYTACISCQTDTS